MRAVVIGLLVVIAVAGSSEELEACVCMGTGEKRTAELLREITGEVERAIAVFSGVVTEVAATTTTFEVDRTWKGLNSKTVTMASGPVPMGDGTLRSSSCDYSFAPNERYLVFAYGQSLATMRAMSCTPTAPIGLAKRTLGILESVTRGRTPGDVPVAVQPDGSNPVLSRAGVCMSEGAALVGTPPVRVGKSGPTVKRLRGDPPRFDDLPPGSRVRPGPWMGEILIGTDGGIVRVWPLREIQIDPPLPAYNETIRTAVGRWTYTTPTLNGTPTPACMTVTVTVDWQ